MIIRILGLGQWSMDPDDLISLNEIDAAVEQAAEAGDQKGLRVALERLVSAVQEVGNVLPDDVIVESDLVLPDVDAGVEEVLELLARTQEFYGLLPSGPDDGDARS